MTFATHQIQPASGPQTVKSGTSLHSRRKRTSPDTVMVRLMGGLGNQMFQFALGLALARRNDARLVLDLQFLLDRAPRPNFTFRDYELGAFNLTHDVELERHGEAKAKSFRYVRERWFHFDPQVLDLKGNVYLDGYWQCPLYFEEIAGMIRSAFSFRNPLPPDHEVLSRIKKDTSVCLHVRRGDLVKDPKTNEFHGTCDIGYFQTGSAFLRRRYRDARFFVFSDDPVWCQRNRLTSDGPTEVIDDRDCTGGPGDTLQLMSSCDHFLISNSSFSWWAAWLHQGASTKVVVPEPWFNDAKIDSSDLLPERWLRLAKGTQPCPPRREPTISVVIPCLTQARFMGDAISSVISQERSDWEIVLINDERDSRTSQLTRDYADLYVNYPIHTLSQDSDNICDALNKGIGATKARFILPLNPSNKLASSALSQLVECLEACPEVSVSYGDVQEFGDSTEKLRSGAMETRPLAGMNQLPCTSMFRREAWEEIGGYNPNMFWGNEDWDFWISLAEAGHRGRHVTSPLLLRRTRREASSEEMKRKLYQKARMILNHPNLHSPRGRVRARKSMADTLGVAPEILNRGMREILAWEKSGRLRRPPHFIQYLAVLDSARRYACRILATTGTLSHEMLQMAERVFTKTLVLPLPGVHNHPETERSIRNAHAQEGNGFGEDPLHVLLPNPSDSCLFWIFRPPWLDQIEPHWETVLMGLMENLLVSELSDCVILIDTPPRHGQDQKPQLIEWLQEGVSNFMRNHRMIFEDGITRIEPRRAAPTPGDLRSLTPLRKKTTFLNWIECFGMLVGHLCQNINHRERSLRGPHVWQH